MRRSSRAPASRLLGALVLLALLAQCGEAVLSCGLGRVVVGRAEAGRAVLATWEQFGAGEGEELELREGNWCMGEEAGVKWVANEAVPQWRFAEHEEAVSKALLGTAPAGELLSSATWAPGKALFFLPASSNLHASPLAVEAIGRRVEEQGVPHLFLGPASGLALGLSSRRPTAVLLFRDSRSRVEAAFLVPLPRSAPAEQHSAAAGGLAGEGGRL